MDKTAHQGYLLHIFLAKVGDIRANQLQEFGENRTPNAGIIARERGLQTFGKRARGCDIGRKGGGIDICGTWNKDDINVSVRQKLDISGQVVYWARSW